MSQQLHDLINQVVIDLSYVLWHLQYVGPASDRLLRLFIDAPEGITLEDCEQVSNEVSAVLDVAQGQGVRGTDYSHLEVSSPGLDRPLISAQHFERFIGERARVTLFAPVDGRRRLRGTIRSVTGETVAMDVDGNKEIGRAHV